MTQRETKKLPLPFGDEKQLPKWISKDRAVLRFYSYFKEAVHESAQENYRAFVASRTNAMTGMQIDSRISPTGVRKCEICVFLEDDTMSITEPKLENCGIPQGTFVKRSLIPKDRKGNVYTLDDLRFGAELTIYGRTFRVIDCDGYTRRHMDGLGVDLGAPEDYPYDHYTHVREEFMRNET